MINYRSYVISVIRRGNYVLADMEARIDKLWVEGKLTDVDRNELIQMAANGAMDVLQIDVVTELAALSQRVYNLEHPVDQFPVYERGQTSIKGQVYRADVTGDGEYDLVRYDGGRASTSLSIGKIEGWHMLDRELNVVATISKDADGNYVITPVNPEPDSEPEPEDEPEPEVDEGEIPTDGDDPTPEP